MPRIGWSDQMSVGVPEIDRQHQRLIELFNNLDDGLTRGSASRIVRSVFAELSSYTKYHFSTEANLLRMEDYGGLPGHLDAHDDFVAKVADLGPMLQREGIDQAAIETNQFLRGWILKHIVVADRLAFAARRKRQGAAAAGVDVTASAAGAADVGASVATGAAGESPAAEIEWSASGDRGTEPSDVASDRSPTVVDSTTVVDPK